jgi:hypothetical protein
MIEHLILAEDRTPEGAPMPQNSKSLARRSNVESRSANLYGSGAKRTIHQMSPSAGQKATGRRGSGTSHASKPRVG